VCKVLGKGLAQFVLKFWKQIRRGSRGSYKLNTRGYEKLAFFDQYLALIRKRYKIRPQLQWKTNRNSYAIYRVVPLLVTFANLDFKVTIFWTSNNSKTVQDRGIVTTTGQYKGSHDYDLSIDGIFNDHEPGFQGHANMRRWIVIVIVIVIVNLYSAFMWSHPKRAQYEISTEKRDKT